MTNLPKSFKVSARFLAVSAVAAAAMFVMAPGADAATTTHHTHTHHGHHHTHRHHSHRHHATKAATVAAKVTPKVTPKVTASVTAAAAPAATVTSVTATSGQQLYVTTTTPAANAMASATGTTRAALAKIAGQSQAQWMAGPWITTAGARAYAAKITAGAAASGTVLPLVVYNIPHRDCGSYSAGGATSPADYQAWIDQVAAGIGTTHTMLILEPDALASMNCLSAADQATRLDLLHYAITRLSAQPNTRVYLDAGNANWQSPTVIAQRLTAAGIADAAGFSLNVSNFDTTTHEATYGQAVSALVAGKHYVIDTSRNGNGATTGTLSWCNPTGRALGDRPTLTPGIPGADALLWVKTIGVSDGACHPGDAPAGTFNLTYALGLATAAHW